MKLTKAAEVLTGICLLLFQTSYAEDKASLCQGAFAAKSTTFVQPAQSYLGRSIQKLRAKIFPSIGYFDGPVLDSNDFISIRQALSVSEGNGATIINVNPFTPEIAKKMRLAFIEANPSRNDYLLGEKVKGVFGHTYFEDFKSWLLSQTQKVSSAEIEQFQKEMEEYLYQVRYIILKTDRQNIDLIHTVIRTDQSLRFVQGHRHGNSSHNDFYLISSIAPVGWNTFYMRGRQKVLSRLGHTTILSEQDRVKTLLEKGELPYHGTPKSKTNRLHLMSVFKKHIPTEM